MKANLSIEMNKPDNYDKTNLRDYQQFIEKLIYFMYKTRLNIVFVVRRLSKYNIDPKKDYFQAVKKVVYYFKGIIYLELVYKQRPDGSFLTTSIPYFFIGYSDNNFT